MGDDPGRVDPEAVEIWQRFAYAFNALVKLGREVLRQHDVSGPQYGVLRILQRDGPATMTELSQRLLVTAGNVTGLVHRLERDGLVKREAGESDRRIVRTHLTDRGRELVEVAAATHHRFLTELLAGWSPEDKRRFRELLAALQAQLERKL